MINKGSTYAPQDKGLDPLQANLSLGFQGDERDYSIVKFIFEFYSLTNIRLLTNNPQKIQYFSQFAQVKREPIIIPCNKHNADYLTIKKQKMGHLL